MPPRVVLIGPPGAGKTAVGAALARAWGGAHHDTDAAIEAAAGMRVADIFVTHGEPHFRALEADAVAAALHGDAAVVSLGGGAPMAEPAQVQLRDFAAAGGTVAFLDVTVGTAITRTGLSASRPLLLGNPRQRWTALMEARRPTYEALATVTVSTDQRTPADIADEIARAAAGVAS